MQESQNKRNTDHVAHIVRDIFSPSDSVVSFSRDIELIETLRKSEHGVEAWGLYTGNEIDSPHARHWHIGLNDTVFGHDFCKMFISIDYSPRLEYGTPGFAAYQISQLMKKDGILFLVNPGQWADALIAHFRSRSDLAKAVKSFYMFKDDQVMVLTK